MSDAISSPTCGVCECCGKGGEVKMYVLQTGHTAWVCKDCREGKKKPT